MTRDLSETPLRGAFLIDLEPISDERGFFARTWCRREFEAHGLETRVAQCSVSFNARAGTLRGLHYQAAPHEEVKIVRCIAGAIFDVIVDLRPESPTFTKHYSVTLSAQNDGCSTFRAASPTGSRRSRTTPRSPIRCRSFTSPDFSRGVRWNDPAFGVAWPADENRVINERDRDVSGFQCPVRG